MLGGYAPAHLFFGFLCRLGGFTNVVLILMTRPNILLFGSRGVLAPNDPRAGDRVEVRQSPNTGSEKKRGSSDVYLPQLGEFTPGHPGRIQTPDARANCAY
jgi:hypothetical protein